VNVWGKITIIGMALGAASFLLLAVTAEQEGVGLLVASTLLSAAGGVLLLVGLVGLLILRLRTSRQR